MILDTKTQAANHARQVAKMVRNIYGHGHEQLISEVIESVLRRHPLEGATREQAARHEAGHLVAFEVEGMAAAQARIYGPSIEGDWCGVADPRNPQDITPKSPAVELLREARVALAGPWAEATLGGGDMLGCIAELLEARVLVGRAAELQGRDRHQALIEVLATVAKMVETYEKPIEQIGNMLARSLRISRVQCEKILDRVRRTPIHDGPVRSPRFQELAELVTSLPAVEEMMVMQVEDAEEVALPRALEELLLKSKPIEDALQ